MISLLRRVFRSRSGMPNGDFARLGKLEKVLEYRFRDPRLLRLALSHRSWVNNNNARGQRPPSNERLEFLGDAVMNSIITDYLYNRYSGCDEGELSKMKSLVVSAKVLVPCAELLQLGDFVMLSKSEERSGGRRRPSILADLFEATLGAVYLDGGYEAVRGLLNRTLIRIMDDILADASLANYKSLLLEFSQSQGYGTPYYDVLRETGPEHRKAFVVSVKVRDEEWGRGTGASKKDAEQAGARNALENRGARLEQG